MKFQSIRTRLLFWFLLVSLAPLVATSVYIYQASTKEIVQKEEIAKQQTLSSTSKGMNQWLTTQITRLEAIAASYSAKNQDMKTLLPHLDELTENTNIYESIIFTGTSGKVTGSSNREQIGLDLSDRDYFQKAMKGEKNFSDIIVSKTTGNRIVAVAVPVKKGEKVVGVLSSSLNFDAFVKEFSTELENQPSGQMFLTDTQGNIHFSQDSSLVGQTMDEASINTSSISKKDTSGVIEMQVDDSKSFVFYDKVDATGFQLYWVVPHNEVLGAISDLKFNISIMMSFVVAIVVIVGITVSNVITLPIKVITNRVKKISEGDGDLTQRLKIHSFTEINQLADYLNQFINGVQAIVRETKDTVTNVTHSSNQLNNDVHETEQKSEDISSVIHKLSQDISSQSDSITMVSETIQEIASSIQLISTNSHSVSEDSQKMFTRATEGYDGIVKILEQMNHLNNQTLETQKSITALGMKSKEINEIVLVINSIADQTNLLALNASIEAARAGEHGRGFAIVAEEVRKLAEQSAQSSHNISRLISDVQQETLQSVEAMQTVSIEMEKSLEKLKHSGESFHQLLGTVQNVTDKIVEVSTATEEMSAGVEEASASVDEVAIISQDTKKYAIQIDQSLKEQVQVLQKMTGSTRSLHEVTKKLDAVVNNLKA